MFLVSWHFLMETIKLYRDKLLSASSNVHVAIKEDRDYILIYSLD